VVREVLIIVFRWFTSIEEKEIVSSIYLQNYRTEFLAASENVWERENGSA
jgi:hypothetical protein